MKIPSTHKLVIYLLVFCFVSVRPTVVFAQQAAVSDESRRSLTALRERISSWLDQPQFVAARWGMQVMTKDGTVIYARDAEKAFMPASNMKLYTTAAAIDAFGPDFRLETSVYATSPISRNGMLSGDLIIYGRGDPNLSARFMTEGDHSDFKPAEFIPAIEALADQIKTRGVKRIKGDLIGDDSYFSSDLLGPGWEWDDAQFYYGAEVSALTVNDNAVTFIVKPASRVGGAPQIEVQPQTSYLSIVNQAETSERGPTRIGVRRPLNSNTVVFFGTIPRSAEKFEVNIAVHDPARFAATLLKEALERRGIRVLGQIRRSDAETRLKQPFMPEKLERVANVTSQPMAEMLKVINKPSQNLHTELMLRQLGALRGTGAPLDDYGMPAPTDTRGNEVRRQFLQKAGVDLTGLSLRDGSGLARQDLVTPRSTASLLTYMISHPHFEVFRQSLPIAGVDGTLNRRMRETTASGNVRAKTGSLSYVNALSGYLTTKRGELLAFSMMGNNYTGPGRDVTAVFDQICVLLCEYEGELIEK
jgi:D-alanyl-D-alanine carboxypeptidase/D-alanyl-D-alanine-endopeptidase (penicillin-binding protein 4)